VLIGVFVSGISYHFYSDQVVYFSINLTLVVSLIGLLWNPNNIRSQYRISSSKKFFLFSLTGLAFGSLFGLFFITQQGNNYIKVDTPYTVTALVAVIIQATLAEELVFRGYLLSYLLGCGFNREFSVVFQSLIFAGLHARLYSANSTGMLIVFSIGMATGYLTWKSNNLIPSSILHVVVNLTATLWWLAMT